MSESWINDFALNVDVFRPGYCGYWLYRADFIEGKGYLAYDYRRDDAACTSYGFLPASQELAVAVEFATRGHALPTGWYLLDRAFAEKALAEGLKKYGEDFAEEYDGESADVAVQRALLGEVVYG